MNDLSALRTHSSLLARLRQEPADQSAWGDFTARYGPRLLAWCRHWGLQQADAEDVTQMVLVRLAAKMRGFTYDPGRSFRGWLKTLARHAWSDFVADRRRTPDAGPAAWEALLTVPAGDDLQERLREAFELDLLEAAAERVRARVTPQTWEAFRLTALEGLSGAEAASQLEMQVAAVFKAKSNVQRMLREEIQALEGEDGT
jgi:RNA polymerase sigma-70 factor (ECF subfamily)